MLPTAINYLAVIVAVFASTIVGFAWYSRFLFGKQWMKLMGLTQASLSENKKEMNRGYMLSMVSGLIQAYVLALMAYVTLSLGVIQVGLLAFWLWLGFIAPTQFTQTIFARKPFKLFLIDTGYQLFSLMAMAAVIGWMGFKG
jgi:hypothetical protein